MTRNFDGFPPAAFAFLRDLAANNDAAWFKPRRDEYERLLRGPAVALAADVLSAAAAARLKLDGDPAKAVFRIYRDVRFAADKRPYKTHLGIVFTRSGGKDDPGLLYIHVAPEGCFLAAGFYQPAPPQIAAIRQAMIADPRGFSAMLRTIEKAGIPLGADADAMKRIPRGCEAAAGTPVEDYVRFRSLVVRRAISEADARSSRLSEAALALYRDAQPLLAFGWAALAARRA